MIDLFRHGLKGLNITRSNVKKYMELEKEKDSDEDWSPVPIKVMGLLELEVTEIFIRDAFKIKKNRI